MSPHTSKKCNFKIFNGCTTPMNDLNLTVAWLAILLGLISGTPLGLFFHRETGSEATDRGGGGCSGWGIFPSSGRGS